MTQCQAASVLKRGRGRGTGRLFVIKKDSSKFGQPLFSVNMQDFEGEAESDYDSDDGIISESGSDDDDDDEYASDDPRQLEELEELEEDETVQGQRKRLNANDDAEQLNDETNKDHRKRLKPARYVH